MLKRGPRNLITDVDGIFVGHAADGRVRTGVTVVLPDPPALAAVDVRGGAPGTRETDALNPTCMVDRIDAICLSGGSAFGLDAASGVMAALAVAGKGLSVGNFRVPIVPAAILFDLANGGAKDWGMEPPYRALGIAALGAVGRDFPLGNVGAGFGAAAGRLKGGLGSASTIDDTGLQVGALICVNPVGSVLWPGSGRLLAAELAAGDDIGPQPPAGPVPPSFDLPAESRLAGHTCIGVVATNLALDKAQAQRIAIMAHDGLARAIRPVHTPLDGDTIFTLSTGRQALPEPKGHALARLGHIAADCVSRAVARAVVSAESLGSTPSYRSRFPTG